MLMSKLRFKAELNQVPDNKIFNIGKKWHMQIISVWKIDHCFNPTVNPGNYREGFYPTPSDY